MSAAHSSGDDEWKDGVFRVDPYWFADNAEDPAKTFYARFWKLVQHYRALGSSDYGAAVVGP